MKLVKTQRMVLSLISLLDPLPFPLRDHTAVTSPKMLSQPRTWFWTNQCLKLDSLLSLLPDLKRTTFSPKLRLNYVIGRSVMTSKRRHPYFFFVFSFVFCLCFQQRQLITVPLQTDAAAG